MTFIERIMFIFGWVRISTMQEFQQEVSAKKKEVDALHEQVKLIAEMHEKLVQENIKLQMRINNPLPGTPPNIVSSNATKGEATGSGIGGLIAAIFGMGSDIAGHERNDLFKNEHLCVHACKQCDPQLIICDLTDFTVDASAKLIIQSLGGVDDVLVEHNMFTKPEEGKFNRIKVMFNKDAITEEMVPLVVQKLESYID